MLVRCTCLSPSSFERRKFPSKSDSVSTHPDSVPTLFAVERLETFDEFPILRLRRRTSVEKRPSPFPSRAFSCWPETQEILRDASDFCEGDAESS